MSSDSSNDSGRWLGGIELGDESETESPPEADNIGPVSISSDTFQYKVHHLKRELNVHADRSKGLSFQIWPSALNLSRFAEAEQARHPDIWKGMRVVELGAGCGLVGLVFAALGAHVLLTDLPHVLDITRSNVKSNSAVIAAGDGTAEVAELSWGTTDVSQMGSWATPDIVIAADVIYDRDLFNPLLQTFNSYGTGTQILLAHVRRWKSDARFFQALRKASFSLVDAECSMESPSSGPYKFERGMDCERLGAVVNLVTHTDGEVEQKRHSLHTKGALKIFRLCKLLQNSTDPLTC